MKEMCQYDVIMADVTILYYFNISLALLGLPSRLAAQKTTTLQHFNDFIVIMGSLLSTILSDCVDASPDFFVCLVAADVPGCFSSVLFSWENTLIQR